jgi:phosphoserine phosphatase
VSAPRYDVVAFDLDGTLLRGTTVSLLTATAVGRAVEMQELERRYAAGQIDNHVIADESAAWLDGRDDAWDALDDAPWITGIQATVDALHACGAIVLVTTITARRAADMLVRRHGFDGACGTTAEVVCDAHAKAAFAVAECERRGIALDRLAAVGDSRSDLPLFARAGCSIALNADTQARAAADVVLDSDDLRDVLPILLGGADQDGSRTSVPL